MVQTYMILADWKKTDPIEEDGEPGRLPPDEFGEREGVGQFLGGFS